MSSNEIQLATLKKPHWTPEETTKAEITLNFVQELMNNHNLDYIKAAYAGVPYVQHNRGISDGINGVISYFQTLVKRFPDFSYDVKNVMVDGDYVTLHAHATVNKRHRGNDKKGFNIIDTWRLEDGKLIEHWDSVQPLDAFMRLYYWLTGGTVKNSNGVF